MYAWWLRTHETIYIYIYMYTNLPVNAIVALPYPRRGDSQGQETFLTPSANRQTRNYDTECSNHHPSLPTLRSKGLSRSKMKRWAIYTNLPVSDLVRLPHPRSGDSQCQETFLGPSAECCFWMFECDLDVGQRWLFGYCW